MSEVWVPILGWEGFYEVSSIGRVRSLPDNRGKRKSIRYLKPTMCHGAPGHPGYALVILQKYAGTPKQVKRTAHVNRLMLESFTGETPKDLHAAHKNGDSSDNRLENLYWATPAQNIADKAKHGTVQKGEDAPRSKLNEKQVLEIRDRLKRGEKHKIIAADFNVTATCIYDIGRRKSWKHLPDPRQESGGEK